MDIACRSGCSCSAKRWTKRAFCKSRMPMSKAQSGKRRVRRSLERWRQRESLRSGGRADEIVFKGHAPCPANVTVVSSPNRATILLNCKSDGGREMQHGKHFFGEWPECPKLDRRNGKPKAPCSERNYQL